MEDIHQAFNRGFPESSIQTLQVRYCTKLLYEVKEQYSGYADRSPSLAAFSAGPEGLSHIAKTRKLVLDKCVIIYNSFRIVLISENKIPILYHSLNKHLCFRIYSLSMNVSASILHYTVAQG